MYLLFMVYKHFYTHCLVYSKPSLLTKELPCITDHGVLQMTFTSDDLLLD